VQVVFITSLNGPTITTSGSLPAGTENTSYSAQLYATGGSAPYDWSVVSGSLPPNLNLINLNSIVGYISGTALVANTYSFRVRVTDALNQHSDQDFTLTINPPAPPGVSIGASPPGPTYTYVQPITLTASASISSGIFQVQFWDGNTLRATSYSPPYTYVWNITSGDVGTHQWMAVAFDSTLHQASAVIDLTVTADVLGPGVTITGPSSGRYLIKSSDYDPNERKYYITPQSVEAVIQEEIQRAKKSTEVPVSESFGGVMEPVKHSYITTATKAVDGRKIQELEREILDLKIANRGKDYLIDQLKSERTGFFEKLLSANQTVGQLETIIKCLKAPD
jgi:hypothetical protein